MADIDVRLPASTKHPRLGTYTRLCQTQDGGEDDGRHQWIALSIDSIIVDCDD